ncbi:MAG: hypothetical protein GY882_01955 [Actinomycetia bacterium]|nr:hypothetical protein [Actinomycetes bacterium]
MTWSDDEYSTLLRALPEEFREEFERLRAFAVIGPGARRPVYSRLDRALALFGQARYNDAQSVLADAASAAKRCLRVDSVAQAEHDGFDTPEACPACQRLHPHQPWLGLARHARELETGSWYVNVAARSAELTMVVTTANSNDAVYCTPVPSIAGASTPSPWGAAFTAVSTIDFEPVVGPPGPPVNASIAMWLVSAEATDGVLAVRVARTADGSPFRDLCEPCQETPSVPASLDLADPGIVEHMACPFLAKQRPSVNAQPDRWWGRIRSSTQES